MPRSKDALLAWQDHLELKRSKGMYTKKIEYVFCRIDGTPLKRFDEAFREACKRANIVDLHFHYL